MDGDRVGGYHWYIPSSLHGSNTPLGKYSVLLDGLESVQLASPPPWIMEVRDGKVFVGEYLDLASRLNVAGERNPFALDGHRAISYGYGFVGDVGKVRVPSYSDMLRMTDGWRQELSGLVTKLNQDVAESFTNPYHLKGFAKPMESFMPEGLEIGANYGDSLWDRRAQQVNEGKVLQRPVLVNAKELAPDRNWLSYLDLVEVDGVKGAEGSKKKILANMGEVGRYQSSHMSRNPSKICLMTSKNSFGLVIVTGLAIGSVIGMWIFNNTLRTGKKDPISNQNQPTLKR